MLQETFAAALSAMDIPTAKPSDRLEDDLGMDSQEVIGLLDEIERACGVRLATHDINKHMTVLECLAVIARHQQAIPQRGESFEFSLVEHETIHAELGLVYEGLQRAAEWGRLPHITSIDILYDDGEYQEFLMGVRGADGSAIKVRSIRRCQTRKIEFFQPEPPKFLKFHCGGWILAPISKDRTLVTTYHHWSLSADAAKLYPNGPDGMTDAKVERLLREHARFALNCWKEIQERTA